MKKQNLCTFFHPRFVIKLSLLLLIGGIFFWSFSSSYIAQEILSSETIEWSVKLNVTDESETQKDTVTIGEKENASHLKDPFDIPKPPPFQPGIRVSIPTDLDEPYDYLWEEYKSVNITTQKWNLAVLWFSMEQNTSLVKISWNRSDIIESGYKSVGLFQDDELLVSMIEDSSYEYSAFSNVPSLFSIQCTNKEIEDDNYSNETDNIVDTPSINLSIILGTIAIMVLIIYFKKGKV